MAAPDLKKLSRIWRVSIAFGLSSTIGATLLMFPTPSLAAFAEDWVLIVIAMGVGIVAQSALFFGWASYATPEIGAYIVTEDTKVKGDTVETETRYRETGDAELDGWIRAYLGARGTTATLLVALTLGGLAYAFF